MDFIKKLTKLTHTPQYKKKFIVLKWLSDCVNILGHDINEADLLNSCNLKDDEYKNILAGSPLVSLEKYNVTISYMKFLYYELVNRNESSLWINKSLQPHRVSKMRTSVVNNRVSKSWLPKFSSSINNRKRTVNDENSIVTMSMEN